LIKSVGGIKPKQTHRVAYERGESCASGSEVKLLLDGLEVHVKGDQLLTKDEEVSCEEEITMELVLPSVAIRQGARERQRGQARFFTPFITFSLQWHQQLRIGCRE
jgi:hypothetical protein